MVQVSTKVASASWLGKLAEASWQPMFMLAAYGSDRTDEKVALWIIGPERIAGADKIDFNYFAHLVTCILISFL